MTRGGAITGCSRMIGWCETSGERRLLDGASNFYQSNLINRSSPPAVLLESDHGLVIRSWPGTLGSRKRDCATPSAPASISFPCISPSQQITYTKQPRRRHSLESVFAALTFIGWSARCKANESSRAFQIPSLAGRTILPASITTSRTFFPYLRPPVREISSHGNCFIAPGKAQRQTANSDLRAVREPAVHKAPQFFPSRASELPPTANHRSPPTEPT